MTLTGVTDAGRFPPSQMRSRERLAAIASGQKSLKPAMPQTTRRSPAAHGESAAAWPAGRIAARRVPPMEVGSQLERRVEVADVVDAPGREVRQEPVESRGHVVAQEGVRVAGLVRQPADAVARRQGGRDPGDVDPARPPVGRGVALGEDVDARPGLGRGDGGRQPGEARPDDDDVSAGHRPPPGTRPGVSRSISDSTPSPPS